MLIWEYFCFLYEIVSMLFERLKYIYVKREGRWIYDVFFFGVLKRYYFMILIEIKKMGGGGRFCELIE